MPLQYDPEEAIQALCRVDATLASLIQRVGRFRLTTRGHRNPFEALTRAIVYQQLSGKAAAAIHTRLLALAPDKRHPKPECILALSDAKLRGAGLSRAKVAALRDLARKTIDRTVPSGAKLKQLEDEEVIARLRAVRGIGVWTAQMLLIFYLGRSDVLPATDLGVRRGYMLAYNKQRLPEVVELEKFAQRWHPYRTAASWYLWQANYL